MSGASSLEIENWTSNNDELINERKLRKARKRERSCWLRKAES